MTDRRRYHRPEFAMPELTRSFCLRWGIVLGMALGFAGGGRLRAGESGLNTVVVVNQSSANSVALGNYYCERRGLPPQNLLRIQWNGGNVAWTRAQWEETLAAPLAAMLTNRGLDRQIDIVLLSMDIPYRVSDQDTANSTTSVLFYGFKTNDPANHQVCRLAPDSGNAYYASESLFRRQSPGADGSHFLAAMLTGDTLAAAQATVEQGIRSDGSSPSAAVVLEKTSDSSRNVRFISFDNAIFDMRLNGRFPLVRTNSDQTLGLNNLLGLQTGLAGFELSPGSFRPGAVAESLTSFGGFLFEASGQTNLLAFLRAGATASFGTVIEPCNYLEKFPDPMVYFYQARGFSLIESLYLSLMNPYEGIIVGEPLAAPFAQPGTGHWLDLPPQPRLSGSTNLSVAFTASDSSHPLGQVDLFVDGVFTQTLTNIPPLPGNRLTVELGGVSLNYTVPTNATLQSITAGLADLLNAATNQTQVATYPTGDRIELEFKGLRPAGADVPVSVQASAGEAGDLTTAIAAARTNFLDSLAVGSRIFQVKGQSVAGDFLGLTVTKTNGRSLTLSVTNADPPISAVALTRQLLSRVNAAPDLLNADGLFADDIDWLGGTNITFFLYARSSGLPAAQIAVQFQISSNLIFQPALASRLDQSDRGEMQPRNHLYLIQGKTNLLVNVPFDTLGLADGFHVLEAVAYEGSHVRTQTRARQSVRIQNTTLEASFTVFPGETNWAGEATLQFGIEANRPDIVQIDLGSTGGWLTSVTNSASATFSISGTNLGAGLHPFYALVMADDGARYRTATRFIRLLGRESSLPLSISAVPMALTWPAVAGRSYDVLASGTITGTFLVTATIIPTATGTFSWPIPLPPVESRYYRVRVTP
jgi:uncharacterized protein (TIGR03790 family)